MDLLFGGVGDGAIQPRTNLAITIERPRIRRHLGRMARVIGMSPDLIIEGMDLENQFESFPTSRACRQRSRREPSHLSSPPLHEGEGPCMHMTRSHPSPLFGGEVR
jgi:hypothetical protein